MDDFKCLYVIIYICYSRSNIIIYSMLVLFAECWESKLSIQARIEKLNGDLHQPSGKRYVSRSFSVRCLVSLTYRKGLIFVVTLSIVVPQSIGSFLHNRIGDHTGEFLVISFGGFVGIQCSWIALISLFLSRVYWCNCNFGMYSLVYLMYCTPMFILRCVCNVIESCHAQKFRSGVSIM